MALRVLKVFRYGHSSPPILCRVCRTVAARPSPARVVPYHDLEPIFHPWVYERKSYRPVEGGRLGAARDLAGDLGPAGHVVAVAGDPTPLHLEADELLAQPPGILEQERPLPDEPRLLVQMHREADAGL